MNQGMNLLKWSSCLPQNYQFLLAPAPHPPPAATINKMPFSCLNSPTDYKSKFHSTKYGTLKIPPQSTLSHSLLDRSPRFRCPNYTNLSFISGAFFTLLFLCKKLFPSVTFTTLSSHSSTPNSYVTSSLEDFCPLRQSVIIS